MSLVIDDAFMEKWDPRYAEKDEDNYEDLVKKVADEIKSKGTISKETFLGIWRWKGAMRVIRFVDLARYETHYATAFSRAALELPEKKLSALLAPNFKLPGVGAPTGSTIIHFIHPTSMPIIDVRTVKVLFAANLIKTRSRDLEHYEEFRQAVNSIRQQYPKWTLRKIDRALFAFHKQEFEKREQRNCSLY